MEVAGRERDGGDFTFNLYKELKLISMNPRYKCAKIRNIVYSMVSVVPEKNRDNLRYLSKII